MNPDDRDDRIEQAAAYVIGTLAADERATVERAMARDPSFAREVGWWRDRLLPLYRMVTPVAPSPAIWRRIEAGIAKAAPRTRRPPLLERLGFWRGFALVATAALVTLTLRVGLPDPVAPSPAYVAVLESATDQRAGWIVEARAGGKVRLIPLGATPVAEGRVLEFWTKQARASAPTSLGIVPGDRVTEIDASRLPGLEGEQLFELSLEPPGGSPTGRPTGPVLFIGRTVVASGAR